MGSRTVDEPFAGRATDGGCPQRLLAAGGHVARKEFVGRSLAIRPCAVEALVMQVTAAGARQAAERAAKHYGWPWDATRAVAHLRQTKVGASYWVVRSGAPEGDWVVEDIDS